MYVRNNTAFIDGQNLYLGTKEAGWSISHARFRTYLKDKYGISRAYYFLGYRSDKESLLYYRLQQAGFILVFKEHSSVAISHKKGNVDVDIVFSSMKELIDSTPGKIFIVSGDGDYYRLIAYLIEKGRFGKILFPNKKFASYLYKYLITEYYDFLDDAMVRSKIEIMHN